MRPAPRSLASQLILLLVVSVVAAQIPVSLFFATRSTRVGRVAFTTRIGERVAVLVKVLGVLPPELVSPVLAAYSIPVSRFAVDDSASVPDGAMTADEAEIARMLARRLQFAEQRVRMRLLDDPATPIRYVPWYATPKTLHVSVRLAPDRWLNGHYTINLSDTPLWVEIGLIQVGSALVAILVALAIGLRRVVRPVRALAEAAERAGRGSEVAPVPEQGPRELRTMTAAFNAMQARLHAFVDDRTRMIGAISHDLRTPLSSLWLRAELVDDAELRDAMVRTLAEMRDMVEATLAFAREDAAQESGPVDLARLAQAVVDEQRAVGRDVTGSGPESAPFHGRSSALRRALGNLVENAVRYGGRASVALIREPDAVRIQVDDDGPGLPPDRVEDMFKPFVRLDTSRSPETGGTGLGLAIARSAVREHGGELTLTNRAGGGLRAEIVLPLAATSSREGGAAGLRPSSPD